MTAKAFEFTNGAVDDLPLPASGRFEYRDTRNPALVLRVSSGGTKSFCVGRKVDGRFVRVTLGTFKTAGDTIPRMTVERARLAVRKADGAIAGGENPNVEKKEKRQRGRTIAEVLTEYLKANKKLKERTRSDYQKVLGEFCKDWLGKPLADITREKIKLRHQTHGKDHSEARANNAVRVLRALFFYAGVTPNPAANPKKKEKGGAFMFADVRKRSYISSKQMPEWWSAVSTLSGKRCDSGASTAADLLRLLVLTGLRAGEACGLEWKHVDVADGMITIPDTKNRDPHTLPLGKLLAEIITRRSKAKEGPYVFGAKESPSMPYSYSTLRGWFEVIAAESGVRITAHDCRRTFASVAASLDISGFTVKRLLNHRTKDVTDGYVVVGPERLRGAMQRIEDEVLRLAGVEVAQ